MAVPRELRAPVASQGYRISGALLGAAFIAFLPGWVWTGVLLACLAAANLAFFRNPRRAIPAGEQRIVSPADGRVVGVEKLDDPDGTLGPVWRVAIFLSIFDVHINRVPISGRVRAIRRKGGRYLAAFAKGASEHNVQTRMDIEAPGGLAVSVVQITGLIARRIVCYPSEGGTLVRGEPYGLICYGSRVEIYLPATAEVRVKRGDRVRGGKSIIAEVTP